MHFKRLVQKWVHDLGAVIAKTAHIVVIFAIGAFLRNQYHTLICSPTQLGVLCIYQAFDFILALSYKPSYNPVGLSSEEQGTRSHV